ncbi:alpha/beta-hydrolase [Morchella conica CCBAS932]|uniref:Alpha/beta-hydrolase n=1 Tax=Morchella conica CCBAS932 TaxID=1392247 RepID=A0A3N4KZ71_9PEZI|nr:alpha/beta-hydrolase [Morchella conica CCBAS932]
MPRYRLAPQNPFPAALLDALTAYLYLLHPPPGALHKPIPASKIIISGDSAGGNLSFALLQLLLHLHRAGDNEDGYEVIPLSGPMHAPKITWQGAPHEAPLPCGIVGASPWVDVSRCFGERFTHKDGTVGSEESCKGFDYLPTPREERARKYKYSPAWPEDVGRSHFYTHDALVAHPLVSPIMAESWSGSPPMWISVGDECLRDANLYFAHRLVELGASLRFLHFTSMPHVFQGTIPHLAVSRRSFEDMAEFLDIVFGRKEGGVKVGEYRVHPVTLEEVAVDRAGLTLGGLTVEDVKALMVKEVKEWAKKSEGIEAKL